MAYINHVTLFDMKNNIRLTMSFSLKELREIPFYSFYYNICLISKM